MTPRRRVTSGKMTDKWPQRSTFRELVDKWRVAHAPVGKRKADLDPIADALGVNVGYLRQLMTVTRKLPGRELITKMAVFFSVSITILWDDHGASGVEDDPIRAWQTNRIIQALQSADLTNEQVSTIAEMVVRNVESIEKLKRTVLDDFKRDNS